MLQLATKTLWATWMVTLALVCLLSWLIPGQHVGSGVHWYLKSGLYSGAPVIFGGKLSGIAAPLAAVLFIYATFGAADTTRNMFLDLLRTVIWTLCAALLAIHVSIYAQLLWARVFWPSPMTGVSFQLLREAATVGAAYVIHTRLQSRKSAPPTLYERIVVSLSAAGSAYAIITFIASSLPIWGAVTLTCAGRPCCGGLACD